MFRFTHAVPDILSVQSANIMVGHYIYIYIYSQQKSCGKQYSILADALLLLSPVELLREMSSCGVNLGIKLKFFHFLELSKFPPGLLDGFSEIFPG